MPVKAGTPYKPEERAEARRLRSEFGMPMKQIAKLLKVSSSSVHNWTADIEIKPEHERRNRAAGRRAFGETWAEKNRERRRQAQAEGREFARLGDPFHFAGCMLYWAEGAKERNCVKFANSDPNMVRFFRQFLTECLGVRPEDLRYRLNVYLGNGLSIREIEDHWCEVLGLPRSCIRGHSINHFPTSTSGKKKNKLPYGVCSLSVGRTDLVQHIFGAIQEYGRFEEPSWLDGPPRKPRKRRTRDVSDS